MGGGGSTKERCERHTSHREGDPQQRYMTQRHRERNTKHPKSSKAGLEMQRIVYRVEVEQLKVAASITALF